MVRCPACTTGILDIHQKEVDIPHFGSIMVSTLICSTCGYRSSDVIPLTTRPPKRYTVKVDSPEKLRVRVVRSGTSIVRIPEMGARIDPGSFSEGYITNVEGVLIRFRDILEHIKRDLSTRDDKDGSMERIHMSDQMSKHLNDLIAGEFKQDPITLIIEDPTGNSAMISEEDDLVQDEELTDAEVMELLKYDALDEE